MEMIGPTGRHGMQDLSKIDGLVAIHKFTKMDKLTQVTLSQNGHGMMMMMMMMMVVMMMMLVMTTCLHV